MRPILLLLTLVSLVLGCESCDRFPQATTSGGSPTTSLSLSAVTFIPATWQSYVGDVGNQANPNTYQYTRVIGTASTSSFAPLGGPSLPGVLSQTSSYTLGMAASTIIDTASYGYWAYSFSSLTGLRVGRSLTLTAKIRLDNVAGKGRFTRVAGQPQQPNTTGSASFTDVSVIIQ